MSAKSGRKWERENPLRYSYMKLRANAKRRGKVFELTFERFKELAIKTDYMNMRGRTGQAYHIDRKREDEGYTNDNVQVLKNVDNIQKYVAFKYRDQQGPHFETVTVKPLNGEDYLF